jgi:multiple sugar transport system substrate-binding protein
MKRLQALLLAAGVALGLSRPALAVDLHMIVAHYSDNTLDIFQKAAKRYEAAHPDVHINVEDVSWDNLQQRLATDIAAGTAPDISIIATRWLLDYVKNDIAEPLDSYIKPEFRSRFYENLLAPGIVDSKTYILPLLASTRALYYNKDLFTAAGIAAPPKTWDELKADAKQIVAKGQYGFGIQGKEIETDTYWYYPFWTYGGEILVNGKSGINSDAGVTATKLYKSFIDEKLSQPSPTGSNRQDIEALFKQGRVGAIISGPWLRGQLASEAPKLKYGIASVPAGTKVATWAGSDSILLFKSSPNKQAAWQFIQDGVFSTETMLDFTLREGFLPALKEEMKDKRLAEDASLKAFTDMLPVAKFAPLMPEWNQVVDTTISALQQVYLGQAEAKPALDGAATKINGLLSAQ